MFPTEITHSIRTKKHQYCRYADTNQWHLMSTILAPNLLATFVDANDQVITEGGAAFSFASRDDFVAFFAKAFETQQTMHVLSGDGEMEMTKSSSPDGDGEGEGNGGEEVKTIWGVVYQAASKEVTGGWAGTGGGHYYETWRVVGGEWMIVELKFQRIYWKVW
ncbi:hypothetical protein P168DRAFT_330498 [Aspergillus campestris IBT 28561]|uniref:Uncharacterized protein n=1 Tax=Aspergillus campestris (strain IBT 28561) TaxID=1392248 RepID=A0A2I1CRN5_ASPC2|nr:uncharacterized protein P168DRAFT_330498 [Aspergillus campestris IBT 28561]PKY00280.1 hypothetical protein P168DRAFT_330498 [Aspergillus campestris IBT 28561]